MREQRTCLSGSASYLLITRGGGILPCSVLVVESGSERDKKASLHFTHAFKPQCWYFIGLERTCKLRLGPDDGFMYCMEHLEENLDDRLTDEFDSYLDDDKQYA